MGISRLLGKQGETRPKSRLAIIADGGSDPLASSEESNEERVVADDVESTPESPAVIGATAEAPLAEESENVVESGVAAESDLATEEFDGAAHGLEELPSEELERRRVALEEIVAMMRPAVQMDGGDLQVIDVDYHAGVVEVELQGACGSCAISSTTLKGGVERLMKERLDWVTEVHGGVDDSVDPLESAAMGRGAYVPRYY
jgi:Fe-S cluster biogenesis protein NfuA